MKKHINRILEIASRLGENGDDTLAHLTTGEVVIPVGVMTPELERAYREAMMLAGMTPEDFIVGSPSQQINRWTKLPMFPQKGETGNQKEAEKRHEESGRSSKNGRGACRERVSKNG